MPHHATQKIIRALDQLGITHQLIEHPPCRTSEESARARNAGGGGPCCGAKAIVVKMKWRDGTSDFNTMVLPGSSRIDAKLVLGHLAGLKEFRFATPAELAAYTDGLEPGMMPPFARPIFERLSRLYVDSGLLDHGAVGFNAAELARSIVVASHDYLKVADADEVFPFASPCIDQ